MNRRADLLKTTDEAHCADDRPTGSDDRSTGTNDRPTGAAAAGAGANGLPALPREIGGREGLEPTRYGDWEFKGRCIDF